MEYPYLWAAMLVATGVAVVVAIAGTSAVFAAHAALLRRTRMNVASGVVAFVLVGGVYVASLIALYVVADRQANPPIEGFREVGIGYTYVHPGPLHKLAPLVFITITWILLSRFRRRPHVSEGAV